MKSGTFVPLQKNYNLFGNPLTLPVDMVLFIAQKTVDNINWEQLRVQIYFLLLKQFDFFFLTLVELSLKELTFPEE